MDRRSSRLWKRALFGLLLTVPPWSSLRAQEISHVELTQLNQALFESMLVRQDSTLFAAVALADVVVIPPGGILENRAQAIAGLRNFRMSAIALDEVQVVLHDSTAVVTGRLTPTGEVRGVGAPGPLRFLNVFVYSDQAWRLLARSLTPCAQRAIAVGRC